MEKKNTRKNIYRSKKKPSLKLPPPLSVLAHIR